MIERIIKAVVGIILILGGLFILFNAATGRCEAEDWKQRAEFYASNYPDLDDESKAYMVIQMLKNEGVQFNTEVKEITIKRTFIYDGAGRRIWPATFTRREDGWTDFQLIEERAKDLDTLFKKKKTIEDQVEKDDDGI